MPRPSRIRRRGSATDPTGTARQRQRYERRLVLPTNRAIAQAKALLRRDGVPTIQTTQTASDGVGRVTLGQYRAELELIFAINMDNPFSPAQEAGKEETDRFVKLGESFATAEVKFALAGSTPGEADPNISAEFNIPTPPEVVQALIDNTGDRIKRVSTDLQGEIMRVVRESALNGLAIRGTTRAIDEATGFGPIRSRMIARTESLRAFNLAAEFRYEGHGIERQIWLSAADPPRVDKDCLNLDGNSYPVRGNHPPMPLHPNCRCTWIPDVAPTRTGRSRQSWPTLPNVDGLDAISARQMLIGESPEYPWEHSYGTTEVAA